MFATYLFGAVCFAVAASIPGHGYDYFHAIDSVYSELPCTSVGGLCVTKTDCPAGHLAQTGLCPEQASKGVECCYGISIRDTRCASHGGHCVGLGDRCPDNLLYKATDCGQYQKCCILV